MSSNAPKEESQSLPQKLRWFAVFCLRVMRQFLRNNGIVLAGAMAYNLLLSIVPLCAVLVVYLSRLFDRKWLFDMLDQHLNQWIPGQGAFLSEQIKGLVDNPQIFGGLSLVVIVFFSTMAFTVTERAMKEIFSYQKGQEHSSRPALFSLALPYLYLLAIGLGLLLISAAKVLLLHFSTKTLAFFGFSWSLAGITGVALYLLGFGGTVLLISSMYVIMPGGKISFRRALWGGFAAALLWEIVRRVMVWYFTKISLVGAIYGSLGTVIVVLLSFEVAAILFLLGAQVIAQLEQESAQA